MSGDDQVDAEVWHGMRYAKSKTTGNYYRVTEWEEKGVGKILAHEKEQIERSEIPDEILEVWDDDE